MIDRDVFAQVWERLCRRFNREVSKDESLDYLLYLDASGLDTASFIAAAEAAWATREFFPRPADFLAGESLRGWRALRDLAGTSQYSTPDKIVAARQAIPKRAWQAIQAIGGVDAIREARDVSYVRREYLSAYEAQVQEEAMGLERRPPIEQPTHPSLRTSGGQPQRILAAVPGKS